jgi:hypothetical protein
MRACRVALLCAVVVSSSLARAASITPAPGGTILNPAAWVQPDPGTKQFGLCKGVIPFDFIGAVKALLSWEIIEIQPIKYFLDQATDYVSAKILGWLFSFHAGTLPVSFRYPGENRFVGDKMVIDIFADLPLPWPITVTSFLVNRHVGPVSPEGAKQVNGGNLDTGWSGLGNSLGATAHVRIAAAGCCLQFRDKPAQFVINGASGFVSIPVGNLEPLRGYIIEADIPVTALRFPGMATNGYCPWPAINFVGVMLPFDLSTVVDWVEVTIKTAPPVVLVPGTQSYNWKNPISNATCWAKKLGETFAPDLITFPVKFVQSIYSFDLCSKETERAYSSLLAAAKQEFITRPTDDMIQVPSVINHDTGIVDLVNMQIADGPVAPVGSYLVGAAKSVGAGTINVVAHSKGGVDILQYLSGTYYRQANEEEHALKIASVVSLSSPFKGTGLAGDWMNGRTGSPPGLTDEEMNKARDVQEAVQNLADRWQLMWTGMFGGMLEPFVVAEQNPRVETKLTEKALATFPEDVKWASVGANADSNGDDRLTLSCTYDPIPFLGIKIPNCSFTGDALPDGTIESAFADLMYQIVGWGGCGSSSNGAGCYSWTQFKHNDTLVDVLSAQLAEEFSHVVLDVIGNGDTHEGHTFDDRLGWNANHHTMKDARIWPHVRDHLDTSQHDQY